MLEWINESNNYWTGEFYSKVSSLAPDHPQLSAEGAQEFCIANDQEYNLTGNGETKAKRVPYQQSDGLGTPALPVFSCAGGNPFDCSGGGWIFCLVGSPYLADDLSDPHNWR